MNKSFTLIEILVVIVVIGVLSAFILVGMSSITDSANIAKGKAFLNSMDNSLLLGRVSQWKLDDRTTVAPFTTSDAWGTNTGTLTDSSGACSFVVPLKCPQLVISGCPSSNCFSFEGTNDYVTFGTISSGNTLNPSTKDWTYSLWIKRGVSTDWKPVFATGPYYDYDDRMGIYSGGSYIFISNADGTHADQVYFYGFTNTVWQYLVMTVDRDGQTKAYLNGINVHSTATTISDDITPNAQFYLAYKLSAYSFVDDVRVYSQAIPTSQIQQNYFIGLNNLYKNNGIALNEFNKRVGELKNSILAGVDN